ncbi:EamA family transporter RarD [Aeromicrobium duanguangcaii]|uniref:EamA family transporter RarD n=1 Tax=Aeromicrobium duanguangcaii TaxID=2968086 RepID=UPI0020180C3E|nr:EamA family transporter RarD [Aeromicrobium duanguangcaii]
MASTNTDSRAGLLYGVAAYLCWGFFPLYWPLLEPASAYEVLAHRIVWTFVFCLGLLTITHKWPAFRAIVRQRRLMVPLALASVVITLNWGGFIWGVTNGHVIETSLGYFINPLMTVLLGVFLLGERLRRLQWVAVALGTIAVVVLTVDYGRPPWIALLLATSFATYGFLKKRANLGTIEALSVETTILTPFAFAFLILLQVQGTLAFGHEGTLNTVLLIGTGIVTAIPLLMFGAAATRLSLTTIGILQYLGPILQFIFGLTIFGEQMGTARWIGFVIVWSALVIFTYDALHTHRRNRRLADECAAESTAI